MSLRLDMAIDGDLPTVPFDKLLRNEEANSCADGSPRREESIEYLRQNVRWDAYAVVCNREDNAVCRNIGIANRNRKRTSGGHGIDRICD